MLVAYDGHETSSSAMVCQEKPSTVKVLDSKPPLSYPMCLHARSASVSVNPSSQMVPHEEDSSSLTSSRPVSHDGFSQAAPQRVSSHESEAILNVCAIEVGSKPKRNTASSARDATAEI